MEKVTSTLEMGRLGLRLLITIHHPLHVCFIRLPIRITEDLVELCLDLGLENCNKIILFDLRLGHLVRLFSFSDDALVDEGLASLGDYLSDTY
ncbi:hypothetical protein PRIPAC_87556 [Pristionchus pacificus]|uniref:Uncharacterized protein n=1 Tax=Pristionchus pacificus TaxID=54126 RepID=A0A2A6B8H6_PRIPA|nr:hypothetical protein PRIPAC_87556 [Pristionchus pacificus]|eukprot:PDM62175.1 hypothetical protein PRIPAC_51617 [Pristionchus pacificus]